MSRPPHNVHDRHPSQSSAIRGDSRTRTSSQPRIHRDVQQTRERYRPPSSYKPVPAYESAPRGTSRSASHERTSPRNPRRDSLDAYRPTTRSSSTDYRRPTSITTERGRTESRRDSSRSDRFDRRRESSRTLRSERRESSGLISTAINTAGVAGLVAASVATPASPYLQAAGVGAIWASKGVEKLEKSSRYPGLKDKFKSFLGMGKGSKGSDRIDDHEHRRGRRG